MIQIDNNDIYKEYNNDNNQYSSENINSTLKFENYREIRNI